MVCVEFNFDPQICSVQQKQAALTMLNFEGTESQNVQNGGRYCSILAVFHNLLLFSFQWWTKCLGEVSKTVAPGAIVTAGWRPTYFALDQQIHIVARPWFSGKKPRFEMANNQLWRAADP